MVEFNDVDGLERALASGEVAAVLAEPALTNVGIVLPEPGYHDALRELTRRYDVLLIIDETHTLSAGPGGYTGAHGLQPDFMTMGKAIAGGIPAGAFGMTAEVSDRIDASIALEDIDVGGIGGTLAGNALSLAAMRATLTEVLTDEAFARMLPLGDRWADGVDAGIAAHGLPWTCTRLGARGEYTFTAAAAADRRRGARRRRLRPGAAAAPLCPEPGHPAHPLPQHGAHVARDHRGRRGPAYRGVPRHCLSDLG